MNKTLKILIVAFLLGLILTSCGTYGFRFSNKGKYFKSELAEDFSNYKIRKVGIYVFSNGPEVDGKEYIKRVPGFTFLYTNPFTGRLGYSNDEVGMQREYFPPAICEDSEFKPSKENEIASKAFSENIKSELRAKGYEAEIVSELGHEGEIEYEKVIQNSKSKGFDAAFIVYYSGLKNWTEHGGTEIDRSYGGDGNTRTVATTKVIVSEGYMYLPNAVMSSTESGKILWSTRHYGLLERAHLFNLSGEDYNMVCTKEMLNYGAKDYKEASVKAVEILFRPKYWLKSYVALPGR
jgi:hypothetical protein